MNYAIDEVGCGKIKKKNKTTNHTWLAVISFLSVLTNNLYQDAMNEKDVIIEKNLDSILIYF